MTRCALGTCTGLLAAGVLALAGCSSAGRPTAKGDPLLDRTVPGRVTVTSTAIAGLGRVLTDAGGHTLYMFPPDAGGTVTCTGACAGTWPPLVVRTAASAGAGVQAGKLATRPDPNTGGRVVTYAGHPLYRYAGDVEAHTAHGQALFNDGGPWYVLSPTGTPITTDPDADR